MAGLRDEDLKALEIEKKNFGVQCPVSKENCKWKYDAELLKESNQKLKEDETKLISELESMKSDLSKQKTPEETDKLLTRIMEQQHIKALVIEKEDYKRNLRLFEDKFHTSEEEVKVLKEELGNIKTEEQKSDELQELYRKIQYSVRILKNLKQEVLLKNNDFENVKVNVSKEQDVYNLLVEKNHELDEMIKNKLRIEACKKVEDVLKPKKKWSFWRKK